MPNGEASPIRVYRGDDENQNLLLTAYLSDVLARASTDELSGYTVGSRDLTMTHIANAITAHINNDPQNIALLGAPPGEISRPIVVGTLKTKDGQDIASFVVSKMWLFSMTPEGVNASVERFVQDGIIDPKELVQKLYGLIAQRIQWDTQ